MTIATDTRVVARTGASAAVLSDCRAEGDECLVVFGGLTGTSAASPNTDVLTTGESTVQWLNPAGAKVGEKPPGLIHAAMVPDPMGRTAVLFGGKTSADDEDATDAVFAMNSAGWKDQSLLANIARGKSVYMTKAKQPTNTGHAFHPSNAVDGRTASNRDAGYCALADRVNNPTISVDLGGARTVTELVIYPRTDYATGYGNTVNARFVVNDHRTDPLNRDGNWHECESPYSSGRLPVPSRISCGSVTGRYVHMFRRANDIQLDVCEIQVMAPHPYTWKQFNYGEVEVARGKPTVGTPIAHSGVWSRINDGGKNQRYNSGKTCTHSINTKPAGETHHWVRLDLGKQYQLNRVKIWNRWEGEALARRLRKTEVWVGNVGDDFKLNTKCAQLPDNTATVNTYETACEGTGRYLWVAKSWADTNDDKVLTVCELEVYAKQMLNVPAARSGHAMTHHRGAGWIFGGIGKDGKALSDLHALDLASMTFNTALQVIGDLRPSARGFAALAPAGLEALVLVGGRTGSSLASTRAEKDYTITLPQCQSISTTGVTDSDCYRGSCEYTCNTAGEYSPTNLAGGPPVTCELSGYYSGSLPVC